MEPQKCVHTAATKTFREEFYVYGSVRRWSILIIVQGDATQSSLFIILQVHSTCFGCQLHPSSGVHKTVTTASGTVILFVQLPPSEVVKQQQQHAAACRIISRLLCVASRWTVINIFREGLIFMVYLDAVYRSYIHLWLTAISNQDPRYLQLLSMLLIFLLIRIGRKMCTRCFDIKFSEFFT